MIHTNNDNPLIVRDRRRGRKTNIIHREEVGDKSVSQRQLREDPGRYYPQWFNPNRERLLPIGMDRARYDKLRRRLRDVHGGVDLIWHPLREVWQVYIKNPNITTWWTKGWERIVMIEPWGDDTSLRTRILAALYLKKPEMFGRAKPSADRVLYEAELEDRKFDAELDDGAVQNARDIYWRGQIRNTAKGSQFSKMYD